MFVSTADIGAEGLEVDRTLPLGPLDGGWELRPAAVRGRVERLGFGFGFRGRLETGVRLSCGRCLDRFWLTLDLPFDLVYRPPGPGPEGAPDADDPAVAQLDEGRIDLAQLVREQVYLALPLKPLCMPHCRGLCSRCGEELNRRDCSCGPAPADPRWAALEELRDKL